MGGLEYKIPALNPGPVKKEIMLCLRDIALDEQNMRYHEYTDGIIVGCGLTEEGMKIGLMNGIVKFAGRLYKLREKTLVPYEPTDSWTILKLRFSPQLQHREYVHYTAELTLDACLDMKPNEMEMGRFKLKKGSRLRTVYKGFADMSTEYDTVNLLHVRQAAPYAPTLSPTITMHFAREAFRYVTDDTFDAAFCTACLQTGQPVSRELIQRYVCIRTGKEYSEMDNIELHRALARILDEISGHARSSMGKGKQNGIMLIN